MCVWASWFSWNPSAVWLFFFLLLLSCVAQAVCGCPFPYGMQEPNSLTLAERSLSQSAPSTDLDLFLSLFFSGKITPIPYTMHWLGSSRCCTLFSALSIIQSASRREMNIRCSLTKQYIPSSYTRKITHDVFHQQPVSVWPLLISKIVLYPKWLTRHRC